MKLLLTLAVAATLLVSSSAQAERAIPTAIAVKQVTATPAPTPAPSIPLTFNLTALAGIIGATTTRRAALSQSYLFNGITYGPSTDDELGDGGTEVPDDFPEIDGESGEVLHADAAARRNMDISRKANLSRAGAVVAGRSSGGGAKTVSGKSEDQLQELDKASLEKLADKLGIVVEREDGDGAPLKADYVAALSAKA